MSDHASVIARMNSALLPAELTRRAFETTVSSVHVRVCVVGSCVVGRGGSGGDSTVPGYKILKFLIRHLSPVNPLSFIRVPTLVQHLLRRTFESHKFEVTLVCQIYSGGGEGGGGGGGDQWPG